MVKTAATVAVTLLVVIELFQVALAFGAPFGKASWGGRHTGVLPGPFRVASAVAALLVYPLIIVAILDASGVTNANLIPGNGTAIMWIFVGLFLLGTLGNLASRSRLERLWAPVSLGIAVCCAVIALNGN